MEYNMKKSISVLICFLFALTMLYPLGVAIAACFGYSFELISVSIFAVVLAVLSVFILVLDIAAKSSLENNTVRVLSAVLTPLSLINAVLCISECPRFLVIASVLLSAGCCCRLTVKYGKPRVLKIIALILSALMILPICFFCLAALNLVNIGQNTVVKTVESPSGKYYAQVIDSDQGALGGDTLVDVYEDYGINILFFKVEKKPQRVYSGDWGEFENMQIDWKDDNYLVINSVEYEIQ